MTLIQAISTGRLYKRSNGPWLKSEREHWPIRNTGNGSPYPLSENDIKATDWVIDIRPKDREYGWIYSFTEWAQLTQGNNEG